MTITQGCRPLALAFGERSTWLAPGSCKHVAKGGDVHQAEGTSADPGAASPAGGPVLAVRDSGRHGPAGLTAGDRKQTPLPNGPGLSPSAGCHAPHPQSGGHSFQVPDPISQDVTSIRLALGVDTWVEQPAKEPPHPRLSLICTGGPLWARPLTWNHLAWRRAASDWRHFSELRTSPGSGGGISVPSRREGHMGQAPLSLLPLPGPRGRALRFPGLFAFIQKTHGSAHWPVLWDAARTTDILSTKIPSPLGSALSRGKSSTLVTRCHQR